MDSMRGACPSGGIHDTHQRKTRHGETVAVCRKCKAVFAWVAGPIERPSPPPRRRWLRSGRSDWKRAGFKPDEKK